ncbi:MAG: ribosomal RNA small subunit methyltransferase A [Candidatus Margulisbacteria bacterium]|nr:ribosomal RNA small subunit methyltransferase A [Candidatus Margulisiibacteriota bacterium]
MTPTLAQITRELLATYNRNPRKRLGQHFLVDPGVLQRIIRAADLNRDDLVVEIGSGLGVMTAEIAKLVYHLIAIEIDKELLSISKEILKPFQNITFVPNDILKTKLHELTLGRRYKIIGNLPYYITAPIMEKILEAREKPELAVLMVQKEVAERMVAAPGSKKYGSFSVFVQYYAEVALNSLVSKSSFLPWPEVGSALVVLKPYQTPKFAVKDEKKFFDIVHAAFQQRRKQLRNSLAKYQLASAEIDQRRRPETLSIEEFAKISNHCAIIQS